MSEYATIRCDFCGKLFDTDEAKRKDDFFQVEKMHILLNKPINNGKCYAETHAIFIEHKDFCNEKCFSGYIKREKQGNGY